MTLLAEARRAIAAGPVCDACLGRPFAERSHGLANRERGKALRVAVALADDEPYEPPEDCWVCEGECGRVDTWAERAAAAVEGYDFGTYQVGTMLPPLLEENDALYHEDAELDPDVGEGIGTELNREVGKRFGDLAGGEVEFGRPDVQLTLDLATDEVAITVNSAFVYGRYRKRERGIPQTEWPCRECNETGITRGEKCPGCDGTGYRYDRSVEELTAPPIQDAFAAVDATFHGAGREDVDARMLGTGRPFVVEVDEPRRREVDADALEDAVNEFADGAVEVEGLRQATYEMVERVKELEAAKTYRMDVEFDEPVSGADLADALAELSGATIEQETPQRVDHRRADLVRTREVYEAAGELVDETHAEIEIRGAGGLYVKELVSGDDGRTEPSLAGLVGVAAEVTALDVLAVEGEEAAFEDEDFFLD